MKRLAIPLLLLFSLNGCLFQNDDDDNNDDNNVGPLIEKKLVTVREDGELAYSCSYNSDGKIEEAVRPYPGGQEVTASFSYNSNGQLERIYFEASYAPVPGDDFPQEVIYTYQGGNVIRQVTHYESRLGSDQEYHITDYTNTNGKPTEWITYRSYDGVIEGQNHSRGEFTWLGENVSRITLENWQTSQGSPSWVANLDVQYSYDSNPKPSPRLDFFHTGSSPAQFVYPRRFALNLNANNVTFLVGVGTSTTMDYVYDEDGYPTQSIWTNSNNGSTTTWSFTYQ